MDDSAKGDALKTHSRVRAWWLTRFRGYDLEHLEESPDAISFGRIVYKRTWWLKPKNKK